MKTVRLPESNTETRCYEDNMSNINEPMSTSPLGNGSTHLQSLCQRLEETNSALLGRMMEEEEQAMKSASQQLGQYWKAGNNAQAVLSWRERLKRDSQKDLQKVREQGKVRVQGLRLQIEACDEKLLRAQEEVQRLREYKDRQRPTFLLQIAALQRQILRLSQTNKEQEADTELLADTEIQKCLEKHQKLQFQALQKIADSPIAQIPLSLRRMCLENHRMKQQIYMYKQMRS
ncbi:uncharacterized protein C20orf96 homolog isoform X6 [Xenopus tropicalis]|uniref:Uncharacterized protein C20orf96 homolog isoform X6 n=1 Tax=Xenopus tropicalis TaxID=8364 RepID=A0A8J1IXF7_XENTR|nr:uncharacterized protein C20orf96 homolog isoform X6 [Xenopus tropicalis]